jgi:hypothetical protein
MGAKPARPRLPNYMGLPVTQGVLVVHAGDHQQPAALICAADIWNTCRTSSRSIAVIFGLSYRGRCSF